MKDESKFQDRYRISSNRLSGWNYNAGGSYFITLCTAHRIYLFGEIIDQEMILNEYGKIVLHEWERSALLRSEIVLGPYVIMPNHFHAIIHIVSNEDIIDCYKDVFYRQPRSLSSLMAGFKSVVTREINKLEGTIGEKIWQSNYYDHIIRNNKEYQRIVDYIEMNPQRWQSDSLR